MNGNNSSDSGDAHGVPHHCYLTGDDTGLIKALRHDTGAITRIYGTQTRGKGVQQLHVTSRSSSDDEDERNEVLLAAHEDATLSVYELHSSRLLHSVTTSNRLAGIDTLVHASFSTQPQLITCSIKGELITQPLHELLGKLSISDKAEDSKATCHHFHQAVSRMRLTPFDSNVQHVCTAGDNNLLNLFDLNASSIVWRAKGPKHDHLNLRQPTETVDFAFMDTSRIVEGTATHGLHLYDIKMQRAPVFSLPIEGQSVLTAVAACDQHRVLASHGDGTLSMFDLRKRQRSYGYKGGTQGSVRAIAVKSLQDEPTAASKQVVVSVSLDRFARVFDVDTHRLISKHYLKQKLLSVLWLPDELASELITSAIEVKLEAAAPLEPPPAPFQHSVSAQDEIDEKPLHLQSKSSSISASRLDAFESKEASSVAEFDVEDEVPAIVASSHVSSEQVSSSVARFVIGKRKRRI